LYFIFIILLFFLAKNDQSNLSNLKLNAFVLAKDLYCLIQVDVFLLTMNAYEKLFSTLKDWPERDRALKWTSLWVLVPGALAFLKRDWILGLGHCAVCGSSWMHWLDPKDRFWRTADQSFVITVILRSLQLSFRSAHISYAYTCNALALVGVGCYAGSIQAESKEDVIGNLVHHSTFRFCFYWSLVYSGLSRLHSFNVSPRSWAIGATLNTAAYAATLLLPLKSVASAEDVTRFAEEAGMNILLPLSFVLLRHPAGIVWTTRNLNIFK